MRRRRAGEDEIDRLDRHDRVAIERVEVEDQNVGRRADADRSVARRAIGEPAIRDRAREPFAARHDFVEAPSAVQEMTKPQFAQDVVVLVEGRGVDAESDATSAPDRIG